MSISTQWSGLRTPSPPQRCRASRCGDDPCDRMSISPTRTTSLYLAVVSPHRPLCPIGPRAVRFNRPVSCTTVVRSAFSCHTRHLARSKSLASKSSARIAPRSIKRMDVAVVIGGTSAGCGSLSVGNNVRRAARMAKRIFIVFLSVSHSMASFMSVRTSMTLYCRLPYRLGLFLQSGSQPLDGNLLSFGLDLNRHVQVVPALWESLGR